MQASTPQPSSPPRLDGAKEHHYVYKITFVDGSYYYGSRSSSVPPQEDVYWGSPITNKNRWREMMYGKEILRTFPNRDECTAFELDLIRPVFRDDPYCLNVGCGRGVHQTEAVRTKIGQTMKGREFSEEHKANLSLAKTGERHHFYGKTLSQEHRDRMGASRRGERNGNFGRDFSAEHRANISESLVGKMWITDGVTSTRIPKDSPIPDGFRRGRTYPPRKPKH